jgi:hypothetical protein
MRLPWDLTGPHSPNGLQRVTFPRVTTFAGTTGVQGFAVVHGFFARISNGSRVSL